MRWIWLRGFSDGSEDVGAQVVAGDGAVGGGFDCKTALCRDASALSPFRDGRRFDAQGIGERLLRSEGLASAVDMFGSHEPMVGIAYCYVKGIAYPFAGLSS